MSDDDSGITGGLFTSGGIFGPQAADSEMLDALIDDNTVSQNEVSDLLGRRSKAQRRAKMLLVERLVDEWPDTVMWAKAEVRRAIIQRLGVSDRGIYMSSTTFASNAASTDVGDAPEKLTVGLAMKVAAERQVDRAVSAMTRLIGQVLYETYAHHDVARAEAQRRLAGTPRHKAIDEWIVTKMDAVAERLGRLWKREPKPENPIP